MDEVCRKMGISQATFYNWKKKYSGLGSAELRRLKPVGRGKSPVEESCGRPYVGQTDVKGCNLKKALKPAIKRKVVDYLREGYRTSINRLCELVGCSKTSYYCKPHPRNDTLLRISIKEIAQKHIRYGYERIHILLKREGWHVNHKRVYRIYCEEGLNLRSKRPRRRVSAATRIERPELSNIDQCWSMDFVHDETFDGKRVRRLTIVDNWSRECMAIHVDSSIKGEQMVKVMQELNRTPGRVQVDNGSEFISKALDKWAYENKVTLGFSRPGKPTDNAMIESFRDECLNCHWFMSFDGARGKIEAWRYEYNQKRPHTSLENLTPK